MSETPTTTRLCASCATVDANAPVRSAHQAEADAPRREMALDHRDLREVAVRVGDDAPVDDQRPLDRGARDQLSLLDLDHAHALR